MKHIVSKLNIKNFDSIILYPYFKNSSKLEYFLINQLYELRRHRHQHQNVKLSKTLVKSYRESIP